MSKYLIQDIIPPEKKHRRVAVKKVNERAKAGAHEEEHTIVHPEHPIRRSAGTKQSISSEFPENPRTMIVDQIWHDQVGGGTTEKVKDQEESERVLPTKQESTPEVFAESYKAPASPTLSPPPPRFPEYSSGGTFGRGGGKHWLPWLIGTGVVIVLGVIALNYFAGATVSILPKHDAIPMDQKFTALKKAGTTDLPYAVMVETASSSLEVPATGEKTVTTKASGRIIVYNEQLSAQRLIKNTRFQNPAGKVYRINDSINIPKATSAAGKVTPGSLEVTVYADEAGPEYNAEPTDFTLPGLKGSPIFTKVYARSNGKMSGGASGTVKTVSDQDLKKAGEDLRIQLETKLRGKARGNLAPSQIVYDQGIVVLLGEPALSRATASADNKAIVTEEGTIYLVTFKRADLIRAIAKQLVPNWKGEPIDVKNLESLQFTTNAQKGSDLVNGMKLDFTVKGTPELTWVIDDAAVKEALIGTPKDGFNATLAQYPAVERAKATIRPMWKRSFPDDAKRISVVLVDALPD